MSRLRAGASDMPEGEALFLLEMGVMIKKIREKASAFRTKKQQALGIRGQEKSPQSHQLNSVSARSKKHPSTHRIAPSSLSVSNNH